MERVISYTLRIVLLALAFQVLAACTREKSSEPATGKAKTSYGQAVERARDLDQTGKDRAAEIGAALKEEGN